MMNKSKKLIRKRLPPGMNIELKSFKIVDASITYDDRESGLSS